MIKSLGSENDQGKSGADVKIQPITLHVQNVVGWESGSKKRGATGLI